MIRFGIIGCGNVSGTYLYVLSNHPEVDVVAISDIDNKKMSKASNLFSIKKQYDNYKEMIDSEKLDAVVVASPHFCHHEQVLYASNRGVNILCEKPLATKMDDVNDIIDASKGIIFSVMLQRRFYPNVQMTKRIIQEGLLGEIEDISLRFSCHKTQEFYDTWRGKKISGGGTVISQALHRLDTLVYCFGQPLSVKGKMKITRDYLEVEDYAEGEIFFESGLKAKFISDNSSGDKATVSIISIKGTLGKIIMSDDKTPVWEVIGVEKPIEIGTDSIPDKFRPTYYGPCHELVIKDFVEAVKQKKSPFIDAEDIRSTMQLVFSFYESCNHS